MNHLAVSAPPPRRLVIVEDEAILALDIERYLTSVGFLVCGVAADSEAALALVERERPDLVLMDIRIQGERDGVETAAAIKARFDVPVVYLTAHGDAGTIERAQATEPMGYLLKPFKKPDLRNVVSIALARSDGERQLRRREQLLATTLSCIGEAVVSADADGKVTYLNPAAEQLVGSSAAVSLQQPLAVVVPFRNRQGGQLSAETIASVWARGRLSLEGTLPGGPRNGEREVVGTAASLQQGTSPFGVVVALRDLTELLAARRQLEFSARLASLGTLAAGVGHEVNNPLSVVTANLDFALDSQELPPGEFAEVLREARDAALRVALIVKDLQSFSAPQTTLTRLIDPREPMCAAIHLTRSHWRGVAGLVLDLQPVPAVMAAGPRLTQVFVALVINAIQAMKGRGPHEVWLSSATDLSGRAVLSVTDDGPGIDEKLRERIFEPFFTTKEPGEGTGLGLAVARSIAENHGGQLTVGVGRGGRGACFTLVLPAAGALPAAEPLHAAWAGDACVESQALCPGTHLAADDLAALRLAAASSEVLLLALPFTQARALCSEHPELEGRVLAVGEEAPPIGMVCLRRPFDAAAVIAVVRRGLVEPDRA
ncbi:MAG: response regulator [Archangium sp.]|nr:response regulator [Archangium sp.]